MLSVAQLESLAWHIQTQLNVPIPYVRRMPNGGVLLYLSAMLDDTPATHNAIRAGLRETDHAPSSTRIYRNAITIRLYY